MRLFICSIFMLAAAAMACPLAAQIPPPNSKDIEVDCQLFAEEKVDVASPEEGILKELPIKEGQIVAAKERLAQIDDDIPQQQLKVAENELKVAKEEAEDNVNLKFARKTAEVAWADYQKALESNRRMPNSVAEIEVMRLHLEYEQAVLSIEKAKRDMRIANLKYNVSEAKRDAAKTDVQRRLLLSPSSGIVVELNRHAGEWVQKGAQILRLVRIDVLRAVGRVPIANALPRDVAGCNVTVEIELTGGKKMTFPGVITFVHPEVISGTYVVRSKIENSQGLLQDGLKGKMIIHMK
jgi:multidrug efflux pump subunit AcrA (membrane-fusion protein)